MDKILRSWEGTPYWAGACLRKKGVSCLAFVDAVLQEMYQVTLPALPRMPWDMGLHSATATLPVLRTMLDRFPRCRCDPGVALEPGDVIVCRYGAGLGHAMIAGCNRNEVWHASRRMGVSRTGVDVVVGFVRAYRMKGREAWATAASLNQSLSLSSQRQSPTQLRTCCGQLLPT